MTTSGRADRSLLPGRTFILAACLLAAGVTAAGEVRQEVRADWDYQFRVIPRSFKHAKGPPELRDDPWVERYGPAVLDEQSKLWKTDRDVVDVVCR